MGRHLVVLLGLVLIALVAVGLSIGAADAKVDKYTKKAEKQQKKCDKLEEKNDRREAKGKELKPLPDYCGFQGQVFDFPDLGVKVTVQAPEPITVTTVLATDPTIIDPERDGAYGGLNKFFNFEASGPFTLAKIEASYDPSLLVNYLDENTLELKFWDSTINDWAQPVDSGVDTTNHVVWAIVDHFSEWAPIADPQGQYANNFEFGRASKPNVPLGVYIKQTFETFNADDVAEAPYDVLSGESFGVTPTHAIKFDAAKMHPEAFSPDTWLETGVFDVVGGTPHTFMFYTKYLRSADSSDMGGIYYYELDAGSNFLPQTGDLLQFNENEAVSIRDYITVTSEPAGNGWLKVTATLTPDPAAVKAKIGFIQYNLNNVGQDTYYVDDFIYGPAI